MTTDNGASTSILTRVTASIAGITPDQYVTPLLRRAELVEYVPQNGGAQVSDEVKRIFSYRHQVIMRLLAINERVKELDVYDGQTPEPDDSIARTEVIFMERGALRDENKILDDLLWAQIRSECPGMHLSKNNCIVDDWTVGTGFVPPRSSTALMFMGNGLFMALAEVFGLGEDTKKTS